MCITIFKKIKELCVLIFEDKYRELGVLYVGRYCKLISIGTPCR